MIASTAALSLITSRAGISILLAGALACFAGWGYQVHKRSLIAQGYAQAMGQVQQARAQQQRELLREYTRLIQQVQKVQHDYTQQTSLVDSYRSRWRAAADRVRQQDRALAQRIATASADTLRQHATVTNGDLERCIGHVERFAGEAASCAATAHALNNAAQAQAQAQTRQASPGNAP